MEEFVGIDCFNLIWLFLTPKKKSDLVVDSLIKCILAIVLKASQLEHDI